MRLYVRSTLTAFWGEHAAAEQPLRAWIKEVEHAQWENSADVKARYRSADFVGDRIVFNIGGNKFRLIVRVLYAVPDQELNGILFVRFIGTHRQYDDVDAATV